MLYFIHKCPTLYELAKRKEEKNRQGIWVLRTWDLPVEFPPQDVGVLLAGDDWRDVCPSGGGARGCRSDLEHGVVAGDERRQRGFASAATANYGHLRPVF